MAYMRESIGIAPYNLMVLALKMFSLHSRYQCVTRDSGSRSAHELYLYLVSSLTQQVVCRVSRAND